MTLLEEGLEQTEPLLQILTLAKNKGRRVFTSFPLEVSPRFVMRPSGVLWEFYEREHIPENAILVQTLLNNCMAVVQDFKAPLHADASTLSILDNLSAGYVALAQTLKQTNVELTDLQQAVISLKRGDGFTQVRNACRRLQKAREIWLKKTRRLLCPRKTLPS